MRRSGFRSPITGITCLILLSLAACSHGEPFEPLPYGTDDPFSSIGFPTRMTFNRGKDTDASWLPDGSAFVYTFERFRFDEGDWCLGVLSATGGRQTRAVCPTSLNSADSVDAWRFPAVTPGGQLAYTRAANVPGREAAATFELVVATWDAPEQILAVRNGPVTLPGTVTHGSLSFLRWLDESTIVYRGDLFGLPRPCRTCGPDTIVSGRDLVLVTIAGGIMTSQLIAGTSYASSVAVRGNDEVFFTRGDDSRVFRWERSTGLTTVAFDFGSGNIARGVQIVGNRLIAVVGGNISFSYHVAFDDTLLTDNGGFVHVVDLVSGTDGVVDQFSLWKNPSLSPDGRRLLVEAPIGVPELFMFELP